MQAESVAEEAVIPAGVPDQAGRTTSLHEA